MQIFPGKMCREGFTHPGGIEFVFFTVKIGTSVVTKIWNYLSIFSKYVCVYIYIYVGDYGGI